MEAEQRAIDQLLSDVVADLQQTTVSGPCPVPAISGAADAVPGIEDDILIPDEMRDYLDQQALEQQRFRGLDLATSQLVDPTLHHHHHQHQQTQHPQHSPQHHQPQQQYHHVQSQASRSLNPCTSIATYESNNIAYGERSTSQTYAALYSTPATARQTTPTMESAATHATQHVHPNDSHILGVQSYHAPLTHTYATSSATAAQPFSDTSQYIPSLRTPQNSNGYPQVSTSFPRCKPPQHSTNCQCSKNVLT